MSIKIAGGGRLGKNKPIAQFSNKELQDKIVNTSTAPKVAEKCKQELHRRGFKFN